MGRRFQPLSACVQVTRTSDKYVHGANGILTQIPTNQPAYDHDSLGRSQGILIEGAATNLLRYSCAFDNALWEKDSSVNIVASPNSTIAAPDGSLTATELRLPGGASGLYQNVGNLTVDATYCLSVWMRTVSGTAQITLGGIDGPSGQDFTVTEDWQRLSITQSASGTTRYPKISGTIAGDDVAILIWNAQLEAGATPTSDIISNGIPAARAPDQVMLDPGDWFVQGAGTFVFDVKLPTGWQGIWRLLQLHSGNLNDDHLDLGYDSDADQLRVSLRRNGTPVITQSLYGALTPATTARIAIGWADDVVAVAHDGVVLKSPDGFAMPRNFTTIMIGSYGGTEHHLNGHVRNLAYWPERLSDARLSLLSQF
ncbi:hypothetical protein LPB41_19805 [Thalassospira sp. MA62]|nr:hypothetical protein [Thalassospira sp. MA62]